MVLAFPILADYAVFPFGRNAIYATHGHTFNENNLPPLSDGDILLHGHTHIPKCIRHDRYTYLNPGSVSLPKENSPHSYIRFDGEHFDWVNLETGTGYLHF